MERTSIRGEPGEEFIKRVVALPGDTVLGDNRPASFDSHAGWLVRADQLVGRAAVSIWPPATWRFVDAG